MFVVRPVQIALCTLGTKLEWRERAFLAYLAPRGIVAAAIASLFATTIADRGLAGGDELRALVFMVIAVTVTVQGLTGGWIAKWLGVRRPPPNGYAILGANPVSLVLAKLLSENQTDVVLVDSNPDSVHLAERAGFRVLYGQGLQPSLIQRTVPDGRIGCIGLTTNPEVNLLWANRVRAETRVPRLFVALTPGPQAIPTETAREGNFQVLFAWPFEIDPWCDRIERNETTVSRWRYVRSNPISNEALIDDEPEGEEADTFVILTHRRAGKVAPFDDEITVREKDEVDIAIVVKKREAAETWLLTRGWAPVLPVAAGPPSDRVLAVS